MATFWAKIPYRNILSELDFLKNKIINYARLISRRTSSFEGLKCRGNPPFSSLEDQMSTVQSAVLPSSPVFFWVGNLSKIIIIGIFYFPVFVCIPNAFLCISLYSLMYSPVFSCIPLYFPVFPCILLYSPVFPCIFSYSLVFSCISLPL